MPRRRRRHGSVRAAAAVTALCAVVGVLVAASRPSLPTPPPPSPFVVTCGSGLCQDGNPLTVVGTNAYSLAGLRGHNYGCGPQADDLDGLLSGLPRGAVVRFWAFQALARNPATGAYDFTGIDRLVAAAQRHGVRLIAVLSNQDGTCDDGHWRDAAYYGGGYRDAYDDDGVGRSPDSFWDYLGVVVPRYSASTSLLGWELVNEPETSTCDGGARGAGCYAAKTCPADTAPVLRSFFDAVGARLRALDGRRHLVLLGVIGSDQCGAVRDDYSLLLASPQVDIATFHDYADASDLLPEFLEQRLRQSRALSKPLLVEEAGVTGGDVPGCRSGRERALLLGGKANAARRAGALGLLPWTLQPVESGCAFDFGPKDLAAHGPVALTAP